MLVVLGVTLDVSTTLNKEQRRILVQYVGTCVRSLGNKWTTSTIEVLLSIVDEVFGIF